MIFKKQRKVALFFVFVVASIALLSSFAFANSVDFIKGEDLNLQAVQQELHGGYSVTSELFLIEDDLAVESSILKENGKWYIETADEIWKKDKDADKIKIKDKEVCLDNKGKEKSCPKNEKAEKIKYEITDKNGTWFHIGATSDVYELVDVLVYNVSGNAIYAGLYRDGVAETGYNIVLNNGKFGADLINTTPGNLSWRFWSDDVSLSIINNKIQFFDNDSYYAVDDTDVCSQQTDIYGDYVDIAVTGEIVTGWRTIDAECSWVAWQELSHTTTYSGQLGDTVSEHFTSYAQVNFFGNNTDPTFVAQGTNLNGAGYNVRFESDRFTHLELNYSADVIYAYSFDYDYNGTVWDESDNDQDGSYANGAHTGLNTGVMGHSGSFPTSDDNLLFGKTGPEPSTWTGSVWMKPHGGWDSSRATYGIWYTMQQSASVGNFLRFNPDGTLTYRHWDGVGTHVDTTEDTWSENWHHFVFGYDGSAMFLYVNGTNVGNTTESVVDFDPTYVHQMGTNVGLVWDVDGEADQYLVFDDVLTPDEIQDLYDLQKLVYVESGNVTFKPTAIENTVENKANMTLLNSTVPSGSNITGQVGAWWMARGYESSNDSHPLSSSLVGHWAFDENLSDETGQLSDGTNNGATDAVGVYNGSMEFAGAQDITVSDDASLTYGTQYTAMAWINNDARSDHNTILGTYNGNGLIWALHSTNNHLFIHDGSWNDNSCGEIADDGTWKHVVLVRNGTALTYYVNGEVDCTDTGTASSRNGGDLTIGNDAGYEFDGRIDDVMIFDDSLNIHEIREIYANGMIDVDYSGSPVKFVNNVAEDISYNSSAEYLVPRVVFNSDPYNHSSPAADLNTLSITTYEGADGSDSTNPNVSTLTEAPTDPDDYNTSQQYNFTAVITDDIELSEVVFTLDDVNYSVNYTGSTYWVNFTALSVGIHNYTWWANDTTNNINDSEGGSYTVSAGTLVPPNVTSLVESPSDPATYVLGAVYTFNATVVDDGEVNIVAFNFSGTNYSTVHVGGGVYSVNITGLSGGVYNYNWWANDESDNINSSESGTYTINTETSDLNLTFDNVEGNKTIFEGNSVETNATIINSTGLPLTIYRDGDVFNSGPNPLYNLTTELIGGVYNVTAEFAGNENFTASSLTYYLTVIAFPPTLHSAAESPTDPATYVPGAYYEFNISIADVNAYNVSFEWEGVNYTPSSPATNVWTYNFTDLAAGTYNYKWWSTDIPNNLTDSSSGTYTVSKASSSTNLLLNGTDDNLSISENQAVNSTGQLITGQGTIQLLIDGTVVNTSVSPVVNISNYTAGTYNVTARYLESENYSASNETHFIIVSDETNPQVFSLGENPASPTTYIYGKQHHFNTSATDNVALDSVNLIIDNTSYISSIYAGKFYYNVADLAAGSYEYYWRANDSSGNINNTEGGTYIINGATTSGAITGHGSYEYPYESTVTGTETNDGDSDVNYTQYRDSVLVSNPETDTLAVGSYTYVYNNSAGVNYTANSLIDQQTLTITQNSSYVLDITFSPSDSETYGTATTVTGINCPAQLTCTLYRNGTLVSNPDVDTLGASVHEYTYNTTGNINYSSGQVQENLTIAQIDDVPPQINVTGCAPDPATTGQTVQCNITATDEVGLSNGTLTTVAIPMNQQGAFADGFSTGSAKIDASATMSVGDFFSTYFRSYLDFNTTAVPDGANVSEVKLQLTKQLPANITISFTVLTNYSTHYTAGGVHSECGPVDSDLYYVANSTIWDNLDEDVPTNETLGTLANNHVASNLTNDRFSVCLYSEDGEHHSNEFVDFHTNESTTEGFRPVLYVTYASGEGAVQANVTMSNGTVEEQTVFNDGNVYYFNFTNTDNIGLHNVTWKATDNSSNVANAVDNFTVVSGADTTNPQVTVLTEEPTDPATYAPGAQYRFNSTVTDDVAVDTVILTFDGANYSTTNSGSIYSANITDLAVGTYNYNWWANDTSGNINMTESGTYTVGKSNVSGYITGHGSYEYPYESTVTGSESNTGDADVNYTLYRDSVLVSNPETTTLAAGSYVYVYNSTAGENYTANASLDQQTLTINQNSSYTLNITFSPSDSETYGTTTTTTGMSCPAQLNCTLYRNGSEVSNPDVDTLAAGIYEYTYNTSGNTNYTSYHIQANLTISKATAQCNLTAPSPVSYPNNVTASISCNHNQQTAELLKNGTPVASPYTELLGVGSYNFSTRFNVSQNYTVAEVNWSVVTVNKGTPVVNLTLNGVDDDLTVDANVNVTYNATLATGQGNIELIENNTVINTGVSPLVNTSIFANDGILNITVRYNSTQNYTAINYTHLLTIQAVNETLNITFVDIGREFVKISWT